MASEILPALALGAGVVGTLIAQSLRERRIGDREAAARAAEREAARDAFQRETLLDLQDAMRVLIRNALLIVQHRRSVYASMGHYGRVPDPEDLSDGALDANTGVTRLWPRVLDDGLREHVRQTQAACTDLSLPPMPEEDDAVLDAEARKAWMDLAHEGSALNEHIGVVLRALL